MKLWFDTTKEAPNGYTLAKDIASAMKSIETAETNKATIENISIGDCEDAAKLLHCLIDRETLYEVVLHTDNLDIYSCRLL